MTIWLRNDDLNIPDPISETIILVGDNTKLIVVTKNVYNSLMSLNPN